MTSARSCALGKPAKRHLGALGKVLRIIQPMVEQFRVPFLAFVRLNASEKANPSRSSAIGSPTTSHRFGPILFGPPLLKVWHAWQTLCELLALFRVGLGEQRRDRLELRVPVLPGGAGAICSHRRRKDRLFERPWADQHVGQNPGHHRDDQRGQNRGNDLVPLERRHRRPFRPCRGGRKSNSPRQLR